MGNLQVKGREVTQTEEAAGVRPACLNAMPPVSALWVGGVDWLRGASEPVLASLPSSTRHEAPPVSWYEGGAYTRTHAHTHAHTLRVVDLSRMHTHTHTCTRARAYAHTHADTGQHTRIYRRQSGNQGEVGKLIQGSDGDERRFAASPATVRDLAHGIVRLRFGSQRGGRHVPA